MKLFLLALGSAILLGVLAMLAGMSKIEDGEDLAQDEDRRAW